ncbi:MAG: cytochrome c [Nocardioides sp.]
MVLLLGALLLSGGLYAAFSPASSAEDTASTGDALKGRELFLVGCAFCHGQNAEGLKDDKGQNIGPSLIGVGAASVDFQMGTNRMPLAAPGQQAPAKKKQVYTDEEIADISAYVASLAPGPSIPTAKDYSTEGLSEDEKQEAIVRGGQIFLTNCTACHNFTGEGGAMPRGGYAPKILDTSEKHIYEAMLTGPQSMDTFSNGNLSPEEKRDVIAYVKSMKEQPGYGGFSLGNLGPVSEGLFAWLFGIGILVGFAVWIAAHTTRSSKRKGTIA